MKKLRPAPQKLRKSLFALTDRLASIALLYVTIALVFVAVLGITATREPVIVAYLAQGEGVLPFLSPAEQSHMHDVALLVQSGMRGALFALAALVLYALERPLSKTVVRDAFLMSLILIALLIPFNATFTWFHQTFFPQGNWQFAWDSWLITHFPPQYFFAAAIAWFGSVVVILGVCTRLFSENKHRT